MIFTQSSTPYNSSPPYHPLVLTERRSAFFPPRSALAGSSPRSMILENLSKVVSLTYQLMLPARLAHGFAAGLMLLNDITQSSAELQKIVAFENAFDRIFSLIQAEGSLTYGGILVQDCLTLLANLLQLNASNQSLFRETGFVIRLAKLFDEGEPDGKESADDALGPALTKERNLWGILAVLRMFLIKGSLGTQANQIVFEKHGILQAVLNLGFNPSVGTPIRAEVCLYTIHAQRVVATRS